MVPKVWIEDAEDGFVDDDENLEPGEVCLKSIKSIAGPPAGPATSTDVTTDADADADTDTSSDKTHAAIDWFVPLKLISKCAKEEELKKSDETNASGNRFLEGNNVLVGVFWLVPRFYAGRFYFIAVGPILSYPILSYPVLSYPIMSFIF